MNTRRRRSPRMLEHHEQAMFVQWMVFAHPHEASRLFAVPNGERRSITAAKRLKEEGVKRGVSDLILLMPNDLYAGFCLEFKKSGETWSAVSSDQREFLDQAEQDGYAAAVAFGFDHGKELMGRYLSGGEITLDECRAWTKEKSHERRIRK